MQKNWKNESVENKHLSPSSPFLIRIYPFLFVHLILLQIAVLEHDKAKAAKKYSDLENAMHHLGIEKLIHLI